MIQINAIFQALCPPLTEEEFNQLEKNCLSEGIREPLLTWNGTLIDGHNRYNIATKNNIPYQAREMHFANEEAAHDWIINNQLGRRNLSPEQKSYLRGKRYDAEKKRVPNLHGTNQHKQVGGQNVPQPKTAEKLAKEYGVNDRTIKRDAQFSRGVDALPADERREVLQGKSDWNKKEIEKIGKEITKVPKKVETVSPMVDHAERERLEVQEKKAILEKAKQLKEERKQKFHAKKNEKIEKEAKKPISEEEKLLLEAAMRGETVVINMNTHFHVLKWAKDNGKYQQIDRYSEFGNPFHLGSDGDRDEVCDAYEKGYLPFKKSLHPKIKDLKSKVLGCHCAPLRCHGHSLKNAADNDTY